MKTYLFSTRPKLPTQSSSRNRLRPFFMVLFLFSIVAILTVNSCTTDFNATQTNKQTNKHSNVATLAETRDAPCGPTGTPPDGCKDTMIYGFPVVVAGCTILVDYKLRKCPTGFTLYDIKRNYTFPSCNFLNSIINGYFNSGNYTAATDLLNLVHSFIATQIEIHELDGYSIPSCESGYFITTQVFSASCLQLCQFEDDRGNIYVDQVVCGDGCCSRYSYHCYDTDKKEIVSSHSNGPIPACISTNECNELLQTPCQANCNRILYNDVEISF